jgi:hypothetical protein
MIGDAPDAVNATRRLWKDRRRFEAKDIWRSPDPLANLATDRLSRPEGGTMFEELGEELLDLSANVRGVGSAVYAASQDDPGSCGVVLCCSIVLCCCCAICT